MCFCCCFLLLRHNRETIEGNVKRFYIIFSRLFQCLLFDDRNEKNGVLKIIRHPKYEKEEERVVNREKNNSVAANANCNNKCKPSKRQNFIDVYAYILIFVHTHTHMHHGSRERWWDLVCKIFLAATELKVQQRYKITRHIYMCIHRTNIVLLLFLFYIYFVWQFAR